MNQTISEQTQTLIQEAVAGNQAALEQILSSVQDMVFNLSLRMLGQIADAEDATQEILIKVMTHLSSFQQKSSLTTWVFSIAINHLRSYQKGMFSQRPLSFEIYGEDIASGREKDVPDLTAGTDQALLARELKLSCTNVMLQCLDPDSRCIYILGTMFRVDSRIAAQILDMTPEAYRQKLSRIRKKVAAFLAQYCGLSGTGVCACSRRVNYAIATHRIDPGRLGFASLTACDPKTAEAVTDAMEELDELSQIFAELPQYRSPERVTDWLKALLTSKTFTQIMQSQEETR